MSFVGGQKENVIDLEKHHNFQSDTFQQGNKTVGSTEEKSDSWKPLLH